MSAVSGDGRPVLQVLEGGASNSRQSDTSVASAASGFDTVRLRFRWQERAYHQAKVAHAAVHARGELRRTTNGITVGAYPDGLVTIEARLAALLYGEHDHRLDSASADKRALTTVRRPLM